MKFDMDQNLFQAVLTLMRKAPMPHEVSDPVIQALLSQANDPKIQSLQYPSEATVEGPRTHAPRRGRPPGAKNKPTLRAQLDATLNGQTESYPA